MMFVLFSFAGKIDTQTFWKKGILRWLVLFVALMSLRIPEDSGCDYEFTSWVGAWLGALGLGPLFVLLAVVLTGVTVWSLLAICAKWFRGEGDSPWLCLILAPFSFMTLCVLWYSVIVLILFDTFCL